MRYEAITLLESPFLDADHLASWAGVAPGNHESAGNRTLPAMLTQVTQGVARTRHTSLAAQYRRLAVRRGTKRAMMALAHSILVMA